jgi:hypothetical protein
VNLINSPNPFSPGTTVQYRLVAPADIRLTVHDATGRVVRVLTEERHPAGPHAVLWNGRDDSGHRLASGTYFLKLAVDGKILGTEKAILIKEQAGSCRGRRCTGGAHAPPVLGPAWAAVC